MGRHFKQHHDIEPIDAYVKHVLKLPEPPTCKCGCNKNVRFYGWTQGFASFATHCRPTSWLKGRSKDDPKIAKLLEASSKTLKARYATGEIVSTTKGTTLSKETRTKISKSIKIAHQKGEWIPWRKGSPNRIEFSEANKKISTTLKKKFATGELISWRKGLSSNNNKMINWCESHSEKLKDRYSSGFKVWVDGFTNDTDERLLAKSIKLRKSRDVIIKTLVSYEWLDIISVPEETNPGNECVVTIRCKNCNIEQEIMFLNVKNMCRHCYPNCSKPQHEIATWLKTDCNLSLIINDREVIKPYEIDILVPGKLGIEFNGLFYHSNTGDQHYHEKKSIMATEQGIQLFHVFEDEWRDKPEIIQSMLLHKLGLTCDKIYARNCVIRDINRSDRRTFFNTTHIDGDVRSKFALGLMNRDEGLVALASFRRPFHKKWKDYMELARFSCKKNVAIPGAYSKLVHAAHKIVGKPILTYVDHRFGFDIKRFENMGLKFITNTKPRFWWTDKKLRYDRFTCKADKLNNITQKAAAELAGLREIYGCANSIFTYGEK